MTVMTTNSLNDDLAFLRTLAEGSEENLRAFAEIYCAAGVIYGVETLLHGGQGLGWLPQSGLLALAAGVLPTAIFTLVVVAITLRKGSTPQGNLVGKSIGAVFGAIGISNLALIVVIGSVAWREHNFTTWQLYPCIVFVLQGMGWLVAFWLRQQAWLGLLAAGWFAVGIAMALCIQWIPGFVALAALGLFGGMALPGYLMLRRTAGA
jgi:hypothetical protein